MASNKLTEYERKRLENIRRNEEMIASLNICSKASQLSAITKRKRVESLKSFKVSREKKKSKSDSPIVLRRSLRRQGRLPDSLGIDGDLVEMSQIEEPSVPFTGPLSMSDVYSGAGSDRALRDTMLSLQNKPRGEFLVPNSTNKETCVKMEQSDGVLHAASVKKELEPSFDSGIELVKEEKDNSTNKETCVKMEQSDRVLHAASVKKELELSFDCGIELVKEEKENCIELRSMKLKPENIARVMPGRIMVVKFLPCNDVRMIVAGNKMGNIAFWTMDSVGAEEGDGIYLYRPHTAPISGILFQQSCLSKIFTSCYDGFLRLLNVEKEVFDLAYNSDDAIFSLSQWPNDMNSLYFGEGQGELKILDERMGRVCSQWMLHEKRINSIDFNSQNPNIMATSSTDGTACLWDVRSLNADKTNCLKTVKHNRSVNSAYFSPSGSFFATTSSDNTVGVFNCANSEDESLIYHNNQTGRWLSSFRCIWGWDDSYMYIGNMKRGVDVISQAQRRTILTLESPYITAIPCRFDIHPYNAGMLAGATSGGQIYMWTSS